MKLNVQVKIEIPKAEIDQMLMEIIKQQHSNLISNFDKFSLEPYYEGEYDEMIFAGYRLERKS